MNFFEQQDLARRNTRLLTALFLVPVVGLILITNLAVAVFLYAGDAERELTLASLGRYFSWERAGFTGLGIAATVALVAFLKWLQLSSGGKTIAEGMGGTRVLPQTRDKAERRCLNIVQEMALAANMPVPPLYVLNTERGINAFAAGSVPADAVVAVTRGALEHLKRHELQGVIGHEFSHILNGDIKLNIRLAALLKGITFIGDVGHLLMRAGVYHRTGMRRQNNEGAAALPLLGLALFILGWLGGVAAGFIKAAISRQKEFLADASAVQYTRDPDGIGDALKVIGGYIPGTLVHAARANELSHIFFGQVEHRLWQQFATHPPLDERIRRVDRRWNGEYIKRRIQHYQEQPSHPGAQSVGAGRAAIVAAAAAAAAGNVAGVQEALADAGTYRQLKDNQLSPEALREFGASDSAAQSGPAAGFDAPDSAPAQQTGGTPTENAALPSALTRYADEPLGASALVLSLLIAPEEDIKQHQLRILSGAGVVGQTELVNTLSPAVQELDAGQRLPLLEICIPALKTMSLKQYRTFKNSVLRVIQADKRTDLGEWCLFQLLRHYLDTEFVQVKPHKYRYRRLAKVRFHLRVVLSVLAYQGGGDAEAAFKRGVDELDMPKLVLLPMEQCSVAAFSRAAHELGACYPLLKPRILKAMALAASEDGTVCEKERELVRALAAVMGCPIPNDNNSPLAEFATPT